MKEIISSLFRPKRLLSTLNSPLWVAILIFFLAMRGGFYYLWLVLKVHSFRLLTTVSQLHNVQKRFEISTYIQIHFKYQSLSNDTISGCFF